MHLTRRHFGLGALALSAACTARVPAGPRKLKLLVLGGTSFLGPQIVEAAVRNGHQVTLFNRGKTNPGMFPKLQQLRGDRDPKSENLAALQGDRRWDAVIDVWPADYNMSQRTGELLKTRVGRYVYVSSISAYTRLTGNDEDESYPLITSSPDPTEYGYSKAETERRLSAIYRDRFVSVRPTSILGWRDTGDALPFWAVRMQRGGDVLAPGDGTDPVQFVDVKDVGGAIIRIAEKGMAGPCNLVGPARPMTFREFLDRQNKALGNRARLVWIPDDFLVAQGFKEYQNFPLYRPLSRTVRPGFERVSNAHSLAAGITFRPLEQTVADALRWFPIFRGRNFQFGGVGQPAGTVWWRRMGIPRARELALIEAWRKHACVAP